MVFIPLEEARGGTLPPPQSHYMAEKVISYFPGMVIVLGHALSQRFDYHQSDLLPGIQQWGGCVSKSRGTL